MAKEYEEFNSGKIRKNLPWLWKHFEMYQGENGIRTALNEKWGTQNVTAALVLVIVIPLYFDPPTDQLDGDYYAEIFQVLMMMSIVLSFGAVILTMFLEDMMSTICPRATDLIYFLTLNVFDLPFMFTIASIACALAAMFLSFSYNRSRIPSFRVAYWICVAICAFVFGVIVYCSLFLGKRHLDAITELTTKTDSTSTDNFEKPESNSRVSMINFFNNNLDETKKRNKKKRVIFPSR